MRIDLHTHTTASDGTESPAELVAAAGEAGLDVVAITDHDTTAGWDEAAEAVAHTGLALVRGIEVSCDHEDISLHLLGYLHDPGHPGLIGEIEKARESRETRAQRIVDRLAEDLPLTFEDVLAQTRAGSTIGRPHIADAMVAKGIVPDRTAAFERYLKDGSPYYVTHYAPDPVRAVELVLQAGGVAVMAHPFAVKRGRTVSDDVIEAMAEAGMAGLEARHRDHSPEAVAHGEELARSLGLFVTGSSDYHGTGKPNRLGEHTTEPEVLARIEDLAEGTPVLRP